MRLRALVTVYLCGVAIMWASLVMGGAASDDPTNEVARFAAEGSLKWPYLILAGLAFQAVKALRWLGW